MAGMAPSTMPPGFGAQYADRQAQQQRLEGALVGSDLDRRAGMMNNIISNAPNIAALSGVGAVDQLGNMFADAETPIFNNAYGQQGDQLRRQEQMARLAAIQRSNRGGGATSGGGLDMRSSDVLIKYPDGRTAIMDSNSAREALESEYATDANGNPGVLPFEIIQWGKPTGTGATGYTQQNVTPTPTQTQPTIVDNGDGTWTNTATGVTVDELGNQVGG